MLTAGQAEACHQFARRDLVDFATWRDEIRNTSVRHTRGNEESAVRPTKEQIGAEQTATT